jgi:hypothetical protein
MAATGFAFANPRPSPDDYDTFNPADVLADSKIQATPVTEPVPAPRKSPPVMELSDVLGAAAIQQITKAGSIVFHSIGDTGGVKEPSHQFAVADALASDLEGKTYANGRAAFFFHLGDVVYYFGQAAYYYDQFYDPYRNYDGPILAIPGNHDGVLFPHEKVSYSLQPFVTHFCAASPAHSPEAPGFARTTMTQPGVYFTLNAPFVKVIGLYSNTGETAGVLSGAKGGAAQLKFLQQQLKAAAKERAQGQGRAVILAVHHPPFTGSSSHFPSPAMLADIDAACKAANVYPDLVLSGHAHLYERYTRFVGTKQIPYIVAGNGGYFNLSKFKQGKNGQQPKPNVVGNDAKGNALRLDHFNDDHYGFLRLTVAPDNIRCEFFELDPASGAASLDDHFQLQLQKYTDSQLV